MSKVKFSIGTPNDDDPTTGTSVTGQGPVIAIKSAFPHVTNLTVAQMLEDIAQRGGHIRFILHDGSFFHFDSADCGGHIVEESLTESSWKN